MLLELRLRGLGAIEESTLELGPGFTAITGETGAGKTMLLTGLTLLLGSRADSALVRPGHERAVVEGRFRVEPGAAVAQAVTDAGGELDGDELVIARTIGADGRSRAYLGGRAVPVATITALRDHLVAIHGQADQRGLLRPAVQRDVLDGYAGGELAAVLARYRQAFRDLSEVRDELARVNDARRERVAEADALRRGLDAIAEVAPVAGEDRTLREESQRLTHVDELRLAASTARRAFSSEADDGDDVLGRLASARHELAGVTGKDTVLDAIAARLAEAAYLLADVSSDLGGYLDSLDADPARLAAVQERLARLGSLTRRYADDVDAVLEWAEQARTRLASLDDDGLAARLTVRRDELVAELVDNAATLSTARTRAAADLQRATTTELHGLAMPHARLHAAVTQRDDPRGLSIDGRTLAFGASGIDDVELLLEPHRGAPPRPLHRGASGGELSRVMLALELVLAGADPVPCLIFDEVDAGIGGRAAAEVGRRLAALAGSAQVLVVTHLPQVAAFADRHVVVAKAADGHVTQSQVDLVAGESRLRELSRMLGGLDDSDLARGHAQELLAAAAASRPTGS